MNIALASLRQYRVFEQELCRALSTVRRQDHIHLLDVHAGGSAAENYEVLLTFAPLKASDIGLYPNLKLIQTLSSGYEQIDVDFATSQGIWVSYAPSDRTGNAESVAEFALMEILTLSRNLLGAIDSVAQAGGEALPIAYGLRGKRVCIFGLGAIGRALIERLLPFGCEIVGVTRSPEKAELNIPVHGLEGLPLILGDADIVVVCVRADRSNQGIFNEKMFASMKRGVFFVNVARGSLIDEQALRKAILAGQVRAAALDVLRDEPISPKDPLVSLSQTVVTPHRAGFTDNMLRGTVELIDGILKSFDRKEKFPTLLNEPRSPRHRLESILVEA
ncbi:D-3-phosphoglycerate dehydrogenase [Acidisarcina polymorpha]|uniref:D-3-phosphoglycerate dehydrogenase n=1 Tax=Acidisarcina polymorpha TaxID=2211140 RepID=A0A2Z5GAR1_9BACT|nr:NAD(P)-dependent oxidoreductase [Acidisarcina polymorpha]AXC15696.1 D-3-phosphoglycerate dehydrogenase [Acidisarcina polymorpha]